MTCGKCKFHISDVNNSQDRKMAELGWKLCDKSEDKMRAYMFFNVNAKACCKFEAQKVVV